MYLSEMARMVLNTQLERIRENLEGCLEGKDPIYLHDLRVANRRIWAALIEFEDLLPAPACQQCMEQFRWIHRTTGEVRDLDVGIADFPDHREKVARDWRPFLEPVFKLLVEKRRAAQQELVRALSSERMADILGHCGDLLAEGALQSSPLALESARKFGSRRVIDRYRKLRNRSLELNRESPGKAFHEFRVSVKKIRYRLEFYSPVLDQEDLNSLRKGLQGIQDALGEHHDAGVQIRIIQELTDKLQGAGEGLTPLLVQGQLIEGYEKRIRSSRNRALQRIQWLIEDSTARTFQSCFQYQVD